MLGIFFARHGNTTYDNKVDALLNPPLNQDGYERVRRAAEFLAQKGYKFDRVISSPLHRALRTADILTREQVPITVNNAALPWNLGDLMGKENSLVKAKIEYLENYPDIRAPHGESYRRFHERWAGLVHSLMEYAEAKPDKAILVTTHSRNINDLQTIIRGAPVGDIKQEAPEASIYLLAQNGVTGWDYQQIWDGK